MCPLWANYYIVPHTFGQFFVTYQILNTQKFWQKKLGKKLQLPWLALAHIMLKCPHMLDYMKTNVSHLLGAGSPCTSVKYGEHGSISNLDI